MEQIYEKLYEAFVPPWATPEETAAGEAGEPYFDRGTKTRSRPLRLGRERFKHFVVPPKFRRADTPL